MSVIDEGKSTMVKGGEMERKVSSRIQVEAQVEVQIEVQVEVQTQVEGKVRLDIFCPT
jgi:hypothetical protein